MSTTQNFIGGEAVTKLRDLVDASPTCMFVSHMQVLPFHVCPMQVQEVDDEGNLWFFSSSESDHNGYILNDPQVQLLFSNHSSYEYLAVFGEATISRDIAKIEELWEPSMKAWFPNGKDDPNLTLLRVHPERVHYWDTKDGKLLTLAKILGSAVTGNPADIGRQGDLNP